MSDTKEAKLTERQYRALIATEGSWLSPEQVARLSPAGMKRHAELWDNVPLVEKLYSRIASDIASEQRRLDQSTFGPDEVSNVCETPMCIAWHTVNLAGSAGYRLRDLVGGFAEAAAMIHAKSRPDTPRPRYDTYPNECALAYIQERADEEQEKP